LLASTSSPSFSEGSSSSCRAPSSIAPREASRESAGDGARVSPPGAWKVAVPLGSGSSESSFRLWTCYCGLAEAQIMAGPESRRSSWGLAVEIPQQVTRDAHHSPLPLGLDRILAVNDRSPTARSPAVQPTAREADRRPPAAWLAGGRALAPHRCDTCAGQTASSMGLRRFRFVIVRLRRAGEP
jgi:hypothetical protein